MRLTARLDDIVLYIICVCNNYIWQKINQLLTFAREKGRAGVWQAPRGMKPGYAQKAKPR